MGKLQESLIERCGLGRSNKIAPPVVLPQKAELFYLCLDLQTGDRTGLQNAIRDWMSEAGYAELDRERLSYAADMRFESREGGRLATVTVRASIFANETVFTVLLP